MRTLNIYPAAEIIKYINHKIWFDCLWGKKQCDLKNFIVCELICTLSSASTFHGDAFLITKDFIVSEVESHTDNSDRGYIILSTILSLIKEYSLPKEFLITREPLSIDDFEEDESLPF